jgi:hypothetical protein
VSLVDSEGVAYAYNTGGVPPLVAVPCPDRIAGVSEGAYGTLFLVGRNRSVLGEELLSGQKKNLFTDVTFVCAGGERVAAHRYILLARLKPNSVLVAAGRSEVVCDTTPSHLVLLFLSWCYTDRTTPGSETKALAQLADSWGAPTLAKLCRGGTTEPSLVADMRKLWQSQDETDLELVVGRGETWFRVHRAVLAARSQFHRAMLTGGFSEAKASSLRVELSNDFLSLSSSAGAVQNEETDLRCMALVVEFLYTDRVQLEGDANLALQLLSIANQFQLQRLLFLCEQVVLESLDSEACAFVFSLAHRYNAPELKTACVQIAKRELEAVLASDAMHAMPEDDKELFMLLVGKR